MSAFDLSPEALSEYKEIISLTGNTNWQLTGPFSVMGGNAFSISGPVITTSTTAAAEYISLMCPAHVRELIEEVEYLREANRILHEVLENQGAQDE